MGGTNLHLFLSSIQNETRLTKEAKATLSLGIFRRVHVLGLWEVGLLVTEIHPSGMEIHRVQTLLRSLKARFPSLSRGLVTKLFGLLSLLQFAVAALWKAYTLRPSHVSCHNSMILPIAWIAAKISSSSLVYVPHELEAERTGLGAWNKKISALIERAIIRKCSAVVVVCEPIAEWYRARYRLHNVFVVRAIPEVPRARNATAHRVRIRKEHKIPDDAMVYIYQGVLAAERGVDELLKVFKDMDDGFHLMLMGYGEAVDRIRAAAADCKRIHFQAAVPVDQIIQYSGAADVGVFIAHSPLSLSYQLALPNKFFEYLFAGLPVIVSNNFRHLADVISTNNLGWIIDSQSIKQLVTKIEIDDLNSFRASINEFVSMNTWESERLHYKAIYV